MSFFRAPTGSIPSSAATYIQNTYGKTIVSYDVDSGDANAGATTEDSYQFYANLASQGTGHPHLTLSHETEANALDALDQGTINLLGSAGIKLVTVAQCLDTAAYETVGNYGVRDSTWNCDASWSPSTPTCQQTYTASATDTTCTIIGAKFGLSGTDISLANPFLNCGSVWQWTPVCIPAGMCIQCPAHIRANRDLVHSIIYSYPSRLRKNIYRRHRGHLFLDRCQVWNHGRGPL